MRSALAADWVSRDGKLLIAASSVRALGQGFLSVSLAVYLADIGLTILEIGAFFTVGAAGVSFFAIAVAFVSEKLGRKRLLVSLTLTSSLAFVALILSDNLIVLAVFAFLGAVSGGSGGAMGATQPLVQASLAETAPDTRRTDTFALYRIVNTFSRAIGALAAGLPVVFASVFGLDAVDSFRIVLVGLTASLVLVALFYAALTPPPATGPRSGFTNPLRLPNRRRIFVLSGLFSMDSLGGSLLITSLAAYWFHTKFGFDLGELSLVFFASELLTATSMWFAAKIANRIGLLNTMVFTHIPASLFLLGAAFSPTAWLAVGFWQLRAFFSQMDVPTRDSYIMAVVNREERVAMASMQQLGRSAASTAGPSISTALWTGISA
ncbi:MAG: MFS transporter, partial [Chloroflexi bacterium]|nr:MFS transporter [Chloroflexota bacterium]